VSPGEAIGVRKTTGRDGRIRDDDLGTRAKRLARGQLTGGQQRLLDEAVEGVRKVTPEERFPD